MKLLFPENLATFFHCNIYSVTSLTEVIYIHSFIHCTNISWYKLCVLYLEPWRIQWWKDTHSSSYYGAWVKVAQSCLTLSDPMDYTVHGILQARILEWVAYPFSSGTSWPRNRIGVSCIAGRFLTSWATWEAHSIKPPCPVTLHTSTPTLQEVPGPLQPFWLLMRGPISNISPCPHTTPFP